MSERGVVITVGVGGVANDGFSVNVGVGKILNGKAVGKNF